MRAMKWAIVLAIGLCVVGLVIVWRVGVGEQTRRTEALAWESRQYPKLLAMKSEAEKLAIEGKLREAHARYAELQQMVSGHELKDPRVWEMMERAKADQDQIYNLVLKQIEAENARKLAAAQAPKVVPAAPAVPAAIPTQPTSVPAEAMAVAHAATAPAMEPAKVADASTRPVHRVVRPATQPVRAWSEALAARDHVSDEQIGQAINRGVAYLLQSFQDGELTEGRDRGDVMHQGLNALCVYALLQCGQGSGDERLSIQNRQMQRMIEVMKLHAMVRREEEDRGPVTYARSLRATALALYCRPEDREALKADVAWLVAASTDGAYTYDDRYAVAARKNAESGEQGVAQARRNAGVGGEEPYLSAPEPGIILAHNGEYVVPKPQTLKPGRPPQYVKPVPVDPLPPGSAYPTSPYRQPMREPEPILWDNSNTQYGLLGVWSGAERGIEVPDAYWKSVQDHWTNCQLANGQWGYDASRRRGSLSMTCGGIASLMVAYDWLDAPALGSRLASEPFSKPLLRGLNWLENGNNCLGILESPEGDCHYMGYSLYGLERVALACGFKYFGTHDWYRELAVKVLEMQRADGSWGHSPTPRAEERASDLVDTAYTLLFLSRGRNPVLMNKLKFDGAWSNRPRDLANFTRFASREMERSLNWQVVNLQRLWQDWMDAPILLIASNQYPKLSNDDYAKLRSYAENGGLILIMADGSGEGINRFANECAQKLFPQYPLKDLSIEHELYTLNYKVTMPRPKLKAVSNGSRLLLVFSPQDLGAAWQQRAEKTRRGNFELGLNLALYASGKATLRNRLSSVVVPEPVLAAQQSIAVARLKYDGNWDPEPAGWFRLSRIMQWETRTELAISPIEIGDLDVQKYPLAHLTGTERWSLGEAQARALRAYVEAGGVLLIDACGGSGEFADFAEQDLLPRAFAGAPLTAPPSEHPLLKDLGKVRVRAYAAQKLGVGAAERVKLVKYGKGRVIVSSLDLSSGLLGTSTWGVLGYEPSYAQQFVRNALAWAETEHAE